MRHAKPAARPHAASLLAALGLLLAPAALPAQLVTGTVVEHGSGRPIAGVEIVLLESGGRERGRTLTDSTGAFVLGAPGEGTYLLRAQRLGYGTLENSELRLDEGEVVELRIRLAAGAIPIDALVVTARSGPRGRLADYHERLERNAFGKFVTREQMERRPAAQATDFLRVMPGVRIVPATDPGSPFTERNVITMRGVGGACSPNLFVDGIRVPQTSGITVDDLLTPGSLEGIEVYTSAAAVPVEYQWGGDCGAVLFWTREGERGGTWSWKRIAIGTAALAAILFAGFR